MNKPSIIDIVFTILALGQAIALVILAIRV